MTEPPDKDAAFDMSQEDAKRKDLPPATKGEIASWASFDFANSSFMMVTVTLVFPLFFASHIVGDEQYGNWLWGNVSLISMLIVVFFSPFIGALADIKARKKHFLFWTYLICIGFTMMLVTMEPGDVVLSMVYLIIAIAAYSFGENLVAAFLPEISTPKNMGRISAIGWGCGYVGSFFALLISIPLLELGTPASAALSNVVVALIFLLAGIPTFLFLRERALPQRIHASTVFVDSWMRVWTTRKTMRHERGLDIFFCAFFLYMCGLNAVTWFFTLYAQQELKFTMAEIVPLLLTIQVSGAIGAFGSGWLQDRIGHRITIMISLIIWIIAVLSAFWVETKEAFFWVAAIAGSGLGSTQSPSRTIVGLLAPPERHGEYFGLWGLFGKLAAGYGPFLFGALQAMFGSPREAILVVTFFFIAGLVLLCLMPKPERVDEPT